MNDVPRDAVTFGPSRTFVGCVVVLSLVLLIFGLRAIGDGDTPGATLLILSGLAFGSTGGWIAAGPVLTLSAAGVRIRQPWGHTTYTWAEVDTCKATSQRRRGLSQRNLEIEAGERLHLLPDWMLGRVDLEHVTAIATGLRSPA